MSKRRVTNEKAVAEVAIVLKALENTPTSYCKASGITADQSIERAVLILGLRPSDVTYAKVMKEATKYALPAIASLQEGQTAGNVALNLGTQILQKNHAPGAATSLLNTVVQLAVMATNVGAASATVAPAA